MQQLHLVGFTTEHDGLIYAARRGARSGSYVVDLDDELLETIEEVLRRRDGGDAGDDRAAERDGPAPTTVVRSRPRPPRPESFLTPREMQARLRSGRTIAQVAREAGVEEEWVERFAAPIFAEQHQIIQRARVMTSNKPRLGDSAQDLGTSVLWNLADRGIRLYDDEFDRAWSAQHWRGTTWVIRFQYVSRKKTQTAEWELDLREGSLVPRNRLASDIGYVEPGRRRKRLPPLPERAPKPDPAPRRAPARRTTAAKRAPVKKAAVKKAAVKKAAAKKAPAKKAPVKKTATRAVATRRATPAANKAVAARRAPARKAAPKKATPRKAAAKRAPARKRATKAAAKKAARPAAAARRSELIVVPRPRQQAATAAPRREPRPSPPREIEELLTDEFEEVAPPARDAGGQAPPAVDPGAFDGDDFDEGDELDDGDELDADVDGGGPAWAGPGSDEPAPSLTIRADLAAAAASARERASAPLGAAPPGDPPPARRRRIFRR